MNDAASWSRSYHRDIAATAQAIWRAWADPANWKRWNEGVRSIRMEGDFGAGTWFAMELPDGEIIRSLLVEVADERRFVDETRIGETVVHVEHHIERLNGEACRVVYAVEVHGSDAREIGEAVRADFPAVLAGLNRYVGESAAG
ncbi:hypothetical protein BRCH_01197 [Candidatus Burkholderia brachyanthoides]|nr:hypothetical protein BRCH_01197 [Candidatus Burkholderia brachyanthoides]